MKNTMKKIMSLLLVAVLLVSAIPFQASAASITVKAGTAFTWSDAPETITKADMYAFMEMARGDDEALDASLDKIFANGSLTAADVDKIDVDAGTVTFKSGNNDGDNIQEIIPPADDEEEEEEEVKDPMDYVEILRPGDDYTPEFTLTCVVNGTRTWTTTELANGVTFGDLMDRHFTEDEGYSYKLTSKVYSKILTTVAVPAADTVTIYITTDYADKNDDGFSTDSGFGNILNGNNGSNNNGSNNNGSNNNGSNNNGSNNNSGNAYNTMNGYVQNDAYYGNNGGTEVNKTPYGITLYVFRNNQVGTYDASYSIGGGIALDGTVTLAEVQKFLTNYYTAKDSNGLQLDGLYFADGNWVGNFAYDREKVGAMYGLDEERKDHPVNIIVMLNNANRKTESTASSDNPKTGDSIMMTVSVMGVSAAALATLFFFNKKRAF